MWSSAKPLQLLPPTSAPAAPKTWLWGKGRTNMGLLPAGRQGALPASLCAPGAGASAAVCSAQHCLHGSRWGFLEHLTLQYQSDQSHVARLPFLSYNQ